MAEKQTCRHGFVACRLCAVVTDAAKRMAAQINARVTFTPYDHLVRSWMWFSLMDGHTDGVLYDSFADASAHHPIIGGHMNFAMRQAQGGVPELDCQLLLDAHRDIYDHGGRWTEPETPSLFFSTRGYDIMRGRVNPHAN